MDDAKKKQLTEFAVNNRTLVEFDVIDDLLTYGAEKICKRYNPYSSYGECTDCEYTHCPAYTRDLPNPCVFNVIIQNLRAIEVKLDTKTMNLKDALEDC